MVWCSLMVCGVREDVNIVLEGMSNGMLVQEPRALPRGLAFPDGVQGVRACEMVHI